ncbi:hypothetical protein [Alteriqipengyuania sp. 357]
MLNILSWLLGILGLIIVIPATIPFLGWANYFAMPFLILGIICGLLSSHRSGGNFCLIVTVIAVIRLMLGGGIL